MSLKQVLGLESFPIGDMEIIRRIQEAFAQRRDEVIFSCGTKKVSVKVKQVSPEGLMRDNYDYYAK